jgi:hypothetical protein
MPVDGGIVAMSGFLYQALVAAGLLAQSQILVNDETELGALVELVKNGELSHEQFDQDLVLSNIANAVEGGVVLIQLKYSAADRNLASYEAKHNVLAAFLSAKTRVINAGQTVSGYWLITNRNITGRPQRNWSDEEKLIWADMHRIPDAQTGLWKEAIERYARNYGCRDTEIRQGLNELVGTILQNTQNTAGTYSITQHDLVRCLGRSPYATPLLRKDVQTLVDNFDSDVACRPVRRRRMDEAMIASSRRALVVFQGPGGSGKTASLHKWAEEISNDPSPDFPFAVIEPASHFEHNWIRDLVHGWNQALTIPNREDAVERLKIANHANVPPILHLSLDGVDDYISDHIVKRNLKKFLLEFMKLDQDVQRTGRAPDVRLVITCRDFDEFRRKHLGGSRSGGEMNAEKQPGLFDFGNFSDLELEDLVQDNFQGLYNRIFGAIPRNPIPTGSIAASISSVLLVDDAFATGSTGDSPRQTTSSNIITNTPRNYPKILKDPVMWRAFCKLEDAEREQWLNGDTSLDNKLADIYVHRFIQKAAERLPITDDRIEPALYRIAHVNRSQEGSYRSLVDWVSACTLGGAMDKEDAVLLKEEALTGGLTVENSPEQWQWRNGIIGNFLAQQGGAS